MGGLASHVMEEKLYAKDEEARRLRLGHQPNEGCQRLWQDTSHVSLQRQNVTAPSTP